MLVEVSGEVRSFSKKNFDKKRNEIKSNFNKFAEKYGAKLNFNHLFYCKGYKYEKTSPNIKMINNIFRELNIKSNFISSFGGSDANFLNSKGFKIVNIGDGVESPHTVKEKILKDDLVRLRNIYKSYISG